MYRFVVFVKNNQVKYDSLKHSFDNEEDLQLCAFCSALYHLHQHVVHHCLYFFASLASSSHLSSLFCHNVVRLLWSWNSGRNFGRLELLYSNKILFYFIVQNDVLIREIYSGCLWYELPVKEEKIIILMLAKAQTEQHLTAANMCPLSMNTALQLTKGIYSFSMMLLTYLGIEK